ncbi:MAG TPA: NlpC/P60 family protein [Smithella sp.]|nr:C40 family peptidase [Smithella sp.]MDM7988619.1 NlpC/P60 family protein [Smithella sp.]HNY51307.1 NlpC/P60 family protein [Smithella sp.]HOG91453.1 NlpC/P60 family protein [Smithella sp.]HOU51380.1 NlpC/P60 family protein [Smithella sp.]
MKKVLTLFFCFSLVLVMACSSKTHYRPSRSLGVHKPLLNLMGYTIQAGAFKNVHNAARLTETLKNDHGLDATYFLASDKLFKVQFGNFATKELARQRALNLRGRNIIEEFYIVRPEDYSVARQNKYGTAYLRESLVKTAEDFIGVPYLWGGASPDDGFDCSGLTMTVYQLNGLNLPRNSAQQFEAGLSISKNNLQKGDLIFFSEKGSDTVSHVGLYIGDEKFIHASSHGGKIRVDSLSSNYFRNKYIGSRTYF